MTATSVQIVVLINIASALILIACQVIIYISIEFEII